MRWLLGLLALTACGRIHFDLDAAGSGDVVSGPDAPLGRFGTPILVPGITVGTIDEDPSLTADMLELYFNSNTTGGDIYVTRRAALTDPWGTPQPVTELNTASSENTPEVAADGLTIVWSSNRAGTLGSEDVWMSTRATRTDAWGTPQHVDGLSTSSNDVAPFLLPDGLTAFLANSSMGNDDIYSAQRATPTDPWPAPTRITELVHAAFDSDEWVSADRGVIYWASERITQGDMDIWRATRPGPGMPFQLLEPVTELNMPGSDEDDPWVSPDGRTIYFSHGSDSGTQMSIYMATR
jgi:hypothetical protein